jgi:hypothetical protein
MASYGKLLENEPEAQKENDMNRSNVNENKNDHQQRSTLTELPNEAPCENAEVDILDLTVKKRQTCSPRKKVPLPPAPEPQGLHRSGCQYSSVKRDEAELKAKEEDLRQIDLDSSSPDKSVWRKIERMAQMTHSDEQLPQSAADAPQSCGHSNASFGQRDVTNVTQLERVQPGLAENNLPKMSNDQSDTSKDTVLNNTALVQHSSEQGLSGATILCQMQANTKEAFEGVKKGEPVWSNEKTSEAKGGRKTSPPPFYPPTPSPSPTASASSLSSSSRSSSPSVNLTIKRQCETATNCGRSDSLAGQSSLVGLNHQLKDNQHQVQDETANKRRRTIGDIALELHDRRHGAVVQRHQVKLANDQGNQQKIIFLNVDKQSPSVVFQQPTPYAVVPKVRYFFYRMYYVVRTIRDAIYCPTSRQ